MTLYEELKWRGLIKDVTSPELENKLNNININTKKEKEDIL